MAILYVAVMAMFLTSCKKDDAAEEVKPAVKASDTCVVFTMYSKRVPYIWKRMVNRAWVQDTIKTNHATRYEPYDTRNNGIGYWVTMNLAGIPTDSLYISAEYKGKETHMSSLPRQSAAYVLLDNVAP